MNAQARWDRATLSRSTSGALRKLTKNGFECAVFNGLEGLATAKAQVANSRTPKHGRKSAHSALFFVTSGFPLARELPPSFEWRRRPGNWAGLGSWIEPGSWTGQGSWAGLETRLAWRDGSELWKLGGFGRAARPTTAAQQERKAF